MSPASPSKQRKALITGIEGFTGRYLAAELAGAGYEVVGLSHRSVLSDWRVHACDLLDRQGLWTILAEEQPDVVVHLAGIAFVGHDDVDVIYRTNVVGTRNLLSGLAAAERRPDAVLLASSANVYGNARVDPIHEGVEPMPANDYGVSKIAMEYMARLWSDRLPITIVRPFNYTGIGQSDNFLLAKIVDHFRRRAPFIELGNLDVARDFSDVRSVVHAYRLLIERAHAGEVVNICSGVAYSLGDVLRMMGEIAGYEIEVRVNPAFVRASEVKCLRGSREHFDSLLGPVPWIPLRETLEWVYRAPAHP